MASSRNRKRPHSFLDDMVDELLLDILVRLPIKSVHRCKCVSKRWCALISAPDFSQQYVLVRPQYSPSQFTVFCSNNDQFYHTSTQELFTNHPGFSFDFLPTKTKKNYLFASCNGLVLSTDNLYTQGRYFICNPLTMQWVVIPSSPFTSAPEGCLHGFLCKAAEYKVVCIPNYQFGSLMKKFKANIFSFDTREWCEVEVGCPQRHFNMNPLCSRSVGCNGVLYWLFNEDEDGIIAYDVYNNIDQCNIINIPKDVKMNTIRVIDRVIGIWQDRLRLAQTTLTLMEGQCVCFLSVWELKNGKTNEWRLEHSILLSGFGLVEDEAALVGIDAVDRDVVYMHSEQHVFLCNLKNKTSKSISPITTSRILPQSLQFIMPWWPYPPSLQFVIPWWPTPLP